MRLRTSYGRSKGREAQPAGRRRCNHCVYSYMIRRRLRAGYQGAGPRTLLPLGCSPPRIKADRACRALNLALGRVPLLRNNTLRTPLPCSIENTYHVDHYVFETRFQSACSIFKATTSNFVNHSVMSCQKAPEWLRPTCTRRSRRTS